MIELRSSKKTALGNNRYALDCHINAIQMREDGKEWEDIDPTLDSKGISKKVPYELIPYLTGMPGFYFKSKLSGEFDVRLKAGRTLTVRGKTIDVQPIIPLPRIEDNQVIWENIYPDTDVVLDCHNTGCSLRRVLKSDRAPIEYDITVAEIVKGTAQLMPLRPAIDAIRQQVVMTEKAIADGRTEALTKQVITQIDEIARPITYPIIDATVLEVQPGTLGDDDYHDHRTGGAWVNNAVVNRAGNVSTAYPNVGSSMRYPNVTIPNAATINVAYIIFTAYSSLSVTTCNTELCCEDADNATQNSSYADYHDRLRTAVVNYDVPAWTAEATYNTPSIVAPVQTVINRAGWVSGNALKVFWEDEDGDSPIGAYRNAYSYDSSAAKSPLLHIEYTEVAVGQPYISRVQGVQGMRSWGGI